MPAIIVEDATYRRYVKFKEDIITTDVSACDCTGEKGWKINLFWNDDKFIDFMLEIVNEQLLRNIIESQYSQSLK